MFSTVFGHLESVVAEEVVVEDAALVFAARAVTREAACPACGTVSARGRSRGARHPCAGRWRGSRWQVRGVDDFAFKKGHVYGAVIVNVETGEPVDVLPDRTADTLIAWLRDHPGAEVGCRDRASAYAEARPHRLPRRHPGCRQDSG
ncbi:hypothetical protein T261_1865 [Streptomyces lydicus]|nr:hypothetical protein T261_1865 [Streptomyces lydicus]